MAEVVLAVVVLAVMVLSGVEGVTLRDSLFRIRVLAEELGSLPIWKL